MLIKPVREVPVAGSFIKEGPFVDSIGVYHNNTNLGKMFRPSMLIFTKNVTRGLGGQCRQMAVCMSLFKSVRSIRSLEEPQGRRVFSPRDKRRIWPMLLTA